MKIRATIRTQSGLNVGPKAAIRLQSALIRVLLIVAICATSYAADEIRSFSHATTCYAVIREMDGDVWYVTGQVFEAWGTSGRTAADYDISLTDESGALFVGDFDTNISAGYYYHVTHEQSGGSPADTDPAVWQEYGYWTGSTWYPGRVPWKDKVADFTEEDEFGGEVGGLDPNLTDLKRVIDDTYTLYTTVAGPNDANNFTLTAGIDANDVYEGMMIAVEDAGDSHWEVRMIYDYEVGRDVRVDIPFHFSPAAADKVYIWCVWFPRDVYDSTLASSYMQGPGILYVDRRE